MRDLTDILVEPAVSPQDFYYTKFITTLVVIVPAIIAEEFQAQYSMISNYVVPHSGKRLNVPEKDGLTIW